MTAPFRSSRPDAWTMPRQPMHASERLYRHGRVQPMSYRVDRPGFIARLMGRER